MRNALARITWPLYWLAYPYLPVVRRRHRADLAHDLFNQEVEDAGRQVGRPASRGDR